MRLFLLINKLQQRKRAQLAEFQVWQHNCLLGKVKNNKYFMRLFLLINKLLFFYLCFCIQGAEEKVKKGYASPNNLEEANKLVNDCKVTQNHHSCNPASDLSNYEHNLFISQDMLYKNLYKNTFAGKMNKQPFVQPFPFLDHVGFILR